MYTSAPAGDSAEKNQMIPLSGHMHTIHENNNDAFLTRPDA
ncbi:hypothetical protein ASZ90_014628 [hydrocarbon metagenome]|uniref:Uncharacterized protein n=1 Tax=hydrocarbon metagenome TaxID=938273 RepID=A0A0W8F479_9ZZZZ